MQLGPIACALRLPYIGCIPILLRAARATLTLGSCCDCLGFVCRASRAPWHNPSPKLHHCDRYLFCLHLSFLPRQTRVARSKSSYRLPHARFLSAPNHGYKAWPPMAHHIALAIGATPKMAAPNAAGASCNGQVVVPVQVQDRDVEVDGVDLVVLKRRCLIRDTVLIERLLKVVRTCGMAATGGQLDMEGMMC